jgi:hypothetical protein
MIRRIEKMGVKLWEIGYGFKSLNNWIVEAKDIDEASP